MNFATSCGKWELSDGGSDASTSLTLMSRANLPFSLHILWTIPLESRTTYGTQQIALCGSGPRAVNSSLSPLSGAPFPVVEGTDDLCDQGTWELAEA